jgi:hypothetical protein
LPGWEKRLLDSGNCTKHFAAQAAASCPKRKEKAAAKD